MELLEKDELKIKGRTYEQTDWSEDDIFVQKFLDDENCVITEERELEDSEIEWGPRKDSLLIHHPVSHVFLSKIHDKVIVCMAKERHKTHSEIGKQYISGLLLRYLSS